MWVGDLRKRATALHLTNTIKNVHNSLHFAVSSRDNNNNSKGNEFKLSSSNGSCRQPIPSSPFYVCLCVRVCVCACLAAFEVHYNVNGGKNGDYFPLSWTFLALFAFYKTNLSWNLTYLNAFLSSCLIFGRTFLQSWKFYLKIKKTITDHQVLKLLNNLYQYFISILH